MSARAHGFVVALLLSMAGPAFAQDARPGFDHEQHAKLFPTCRTCHAGAANPGDPLWPTPASCAACHDGTILKAVSWRPPSDVRPNNLTFNHRSHAAAVARGAPGARGGLPESSPTCVSCHAAAGAPWMVVRWAATQRCLECHGVRVPHLAAPDTTCATCHLPLSRATRLSARQVADFPTPPSHREPGFLSDHARGHGAQARVMPPVAASCATCHARDFCLQCHVDAPEQPTIQALAPDARSLAIRARLEAPASHAAPAFVTAHGALARANPRQCSTCHTRESCLTCHATLPSVVAALPPAAHGRAVGAIVVRRPPASHGESFVRAHAAAANAVPSGCAGCHVRADCLECHRPDAARTAGFHPRGFLTRHPAAAYAREASCGDCHNVAAFCTPCHVDAGLVRRDAQFRSRYHDAKQFFLAGHGGAARQSLESCVSCHAERDCLTCHSARGGRRFNPHGPGFDARRLAKKNPQMCSACHGGAIPTR